MKGTAHLCAHNILIVFIRACVCVISYFSLFTGREYRKNDPSVTVDYSTSDPVVRWDSYENFNLHHQDSIEGKGETRVHTLYHTHT